MQEWQPIETAPTDGCWILVARGNQLGVARWNGSHWSLGAMCYFNNPTHWMPLPPAPINHASDCALHNMPAFPNGPCDCGVGAP